MLFLEFLLSLADPSSAPSAAPGQEPLAAQLGGGPAGSARPNIVLVILDDLGVDKIGAYHQFPPTADPPCTPHIDALAARGLLFRQTWANPVCSPTRAQLLTGRHGFRTGIGEVLDFQGSGVGLSNALEVTLPELLTGYDSSAVGKWHLAALGPESLRHPLEAGFRYFAGSLFNIATPPIATSTSATSTRNGGEGAAPDCAALGPLGYYNWVKVRESPGEARLQQVCERTYATTDTADEAIARARNMHAPWFLQVAFNAGHAPFEAPPPELVPEDCARSSGQGERRFELLRAMVAALDTEIGRMLAEIRRVDPAAMIFLIGDNGTSIPGSQGESGGCFAPERSKGSLFEGGIHVPLIVAGPGVVPGECAALVAATDLFATIADLAQVKSAAQDSVSLLPYFRGDRTPRRATVYAESFLPNCTSPDAPGSAPFQPKHHTRALRNSRYKLIRSTHDNGKEEEHFFDLLQDPCEELDLFGTGRAPCDTGMLAPEALENLEALRAGLMDLGVYQ